MTKIIFALAIYLFLSQASANPTPDLVFQCGQDFQRELTRISNNEFMMSEGFAKASLESSHAYFLVNNSDLHWSKNKCQMELKALKVDGPNGRAYGKKHMAYKFKFQFQKNNGPSSLVFAEEGKPPVNCTISPKFVTRLKDCQLPTEIPDAMVCQSQVVDGTQVRTVFRYDTISGVSERQVYKVTTVAADPKDANSKPQSKEEDLGIRGTKFQWKKKSKFCELRVQEKEEDDDHWLDFKMKFDRRHAQNQAGVFQKMRILLDHEHVADLLDDKKNVQCTVSQPVFQQSIRCVTAMNSLPLRVPAQTGKTKVLKSSPSGCKIKL